MGLLKQETRHGHSVEYWVIVSFPSNMIKRSGPIRLHGYPSRQVYKDAPKTGEGNPRWAQRSVSVPQQDFEPIYFASLQDAWPYNLHEMMYAYVTGDASKLPERPDGTQITGVEDTQDDANFFADATSDHAEQK